MIERLMEVGDMLFVSRIESRLFHAPKSVIESTSGATLGGALSAVDAAIAQGSYVAGFLCYEAGWPLMDRPLPAKGRALPLLWFGVYDDCIVLPGRLDGDQERVPSVQWQPQISKQAYRRCIDAIRDYIQAGDCYQVNYTFPLTASFRGDPECWFRQLYAAQPTDHAVYLHLGQQRILSLSPELFFQLDGHVLLTRPMKGTLPRGPWPEADARARERLRVSEKDRAENLMIVDLLRNDVGRISDIGSVRVDDLFTMERYATVWQMTSTVESRTEASFTEIMTALFPCGSVTGAPKIRAMGIIDELEPDARDLYCGTLGWWGPQRQASFNVAIRTLMLDVETGLARYPVGGGITWDSSHSGEYAECLAKAAVLSRAAPTFDLLETLLCEDGVYFLLEDHLDRLCASAAYFDRPVSRDTVRAALLARAREVGPGQWKVRLLLTRTGACRIEVAPAPPARAMGIALATSCVHSDNVLLYHKTTQRDVYDAARAEQPDVDDVLLWNERGEITETTRANIVLDWEGAWITPPISCGLLPGVMRADLLRAGTIREETIPKERITEASQLFLINSLRKQFPAHLRGEQ